MFMKKNFFLIIFFLFGFQCFAQRKISFDEGWRFHRGDVAKAEDVNFKDKSWRNIDLPHDWSIEDLPGTESPFSPDVINGVSIGFTTGGIGWYRKTFTLPVNQQNKRISILFDGVYMNSDVWINGVHLGNHPYGYTSFYYDLTSHLKDGENAVAIRANNSGRNSRWYSGSGIYRKVWLNSSGELRVPHYGVSITTPEVAADRALVNVAVT